MNAPQALPPARLDVPRRQHTRGLPLPEELLREAEQLFGEDLSDVRIHVGPEAARARARAFTAGPNIYFAPGLYDPATEEGLRLIGHELAHVVQQKTGRASNRLGYGVMVLRDDGLEVEANRKGREFAGQVIQRKAAPPPPPTGARPHETRRVVQPMLEFLDLFGGLFSPSPPPSSQPVQVRPPEVSILAVERTFIGMEEKLRAVTTPSVPSGFTYRWKIASGNAVLSAQPSSAGATTINTPHNSAYFIGRAAGRITVRVDCLDDDRTVATASQAITVYERARISKLIHFVWAGGTKAMGPKTIENVVNWANRNRAYDVVVCIWVDKKTDPEVMKKYPDDVANLRVLDITEAGLCVDDGTDPVRYEIDRLWPNYGASSDLLRYRILHKYGGAYFDGDVYAGLTPLGGTMAMSFGAFSSFMVSDNSQNSGSIGNDTFLCGRGDGTIRAIEQRATQNYRELATEAFKYNMADAYEDYIYKRESTIRRTGPTCVRYTLRQLGIASPDERLTSDIYRIPGGIVTIPEDETNTEGWLKVPVRKMRVQDAVAAAAAEMRFEIQFMGMFRTVDHVCQIAVSAGIELTTYKRLEDYKATFYTIDRDAPADENELEIAGYLVEALGGGLDLRIAKDEFAKSGGETCERVCRYKVFEKLYDAITK